MLMVAFGYHANFSSLPIHALGINKIITLISAVSGEGTSTVCDEFAKEIGGSGLLLRIIPIAASIDVQVFGESNRWLADNLAEWIIPTTNNELSTDCLRQPAFWQALRAYNGWVIIDAPAVNASHLGLTAASNSDLTVLVVAAESTRHQVVAHGRDLLLSAGAKMAGVILNKRRYYIPDKVYSRL